MVSEELFLVDPTSIITSTFGISNEAASIILLIILAWSLTWKGLSMWKAAGKHNKIWFVVLLIANTIGILDILYIYVFSELKFENKNNSNKRKINK